MSERSEPMTRATTANRDASQLVTAVFTAWREAGIDFLVLRNYEGLPEYTTNDIDVLVRRSDRSRAEVVLLQAAGRAGFRLHNRAEFATLALYLSCPTTGEEVHFDLFVDLQWRGFDFLEAGAFLDRRVNRGLFDIPHPVDEGASKLLAIMIYTGKVKDHYKPSIATAFKSGGKEAGGLLARTYGQGLAEVLVAAGAAEKWAEVEALTPALRRALIWRQAVLSPLRTLASLARSVRRWVSRWLHPPGLTVVLCGPDGCGKSTAGKALIENLKGTFSPRKGKYYHWKPPVFSAGRRAARGPVSDPHARPPRSVIASCLALGAHLLEFFLGTFLAIRPATFKGGLVLVDRFYYDFFVDQRRYRMQAPLWLVRWGYRLLPKPNLVFLLDAPPEVLQSRKRETSLQETTRQREAYREALLPLSNCRLIDAGQPVDDVVRAMKKAILDYTAARTLEGQG